MRRMITVWILTALLGLLAGAGCTAAATPPPTSTPAPLAIYRIDSTTPAIPADPRRWDTIRARAMAVFHGQRVVVAHLGDDRERRQHIRFSANSNLPDIGEVFFAFCPDDGSYADCLKRGSPQE